MEVERRLGHGGLLANITGPMVGAVARTGKHNAARTRAVRESGPAGSRLFHLQLLLQARDGGVLLPLDACEGQAGLLQAPGRLLCPPHGIGNELPLLDQLCARLVQLHGFVALFRVELVSPLLASKPEFCHLGEIGCAYVQLLSFKGQFRKG